ncbi:hypothetical protein SapgrDRAFT_3544 [Saprospira grandis DSM 2844]|uniref:Uncharacterized protein n=1 Tax=Saprospira grandis DSM 2844 TaxID=694433 RepID=J0PC22_9BACT|nr:hypothetical protein [Saprospira grandis]EJF55177.1 hypothetical protein SapgrDRAFT_3544 [Saprospira grandis DSM 2844]
MVKVTWPQEEGKQNLELYLIVLQYIFEGTSLRFTENISFDPLEIFARYLENEITHNEYLNYIAICESFISQPENFRDHISKDVLWNRLALLCMPENSDEESLWESISYLYTYGKGLGHLFSVEDRKFSKVDLK